MKENIKSVGMDVNISNEALKKVTAEQVFNANVVETLINIGILKYGKYQDENGVHYRWKIEDTNTEKILELIDNMIAEWDSVKTWAGICKRDALKELKAEIEYRIKNGGV